MADYPVPDFKNPTDRGVEAWALRTNRLHPKVRDFLRPLFRGYLDLLSVRFIVYPKNTSGLKTTVWVAGDKIIWTKGHFNQEWAQWLVDKGDGKNWYRSNGAIDLATTHGMEVLCHELWHVKQYRDLPWWKTIGLYAWGVAKSLLYERRWYSHNQVWQEVDALKFQKGRARDYIRARREDLAQFAEIR